MSSDSEARSTKKQNRCVSVGEESGHDTRLLVGQGRGEGMSVYPQSGKGESRLEMELGAGLVWRRMWVVRCWGCWRVC
jgi:hypothetical protein